MTCLLCKQPIVGKRAVGDDRWRNRNGVIIAVPAGKGYVHTVCFHQEAAALKFDVHGIERTVGK